MSLISIIVPVYNVGLYIQRCVCSILAQTSTDFELILVDDGSTDGSGRICEEYAALDGRVKVIHKQNGGLSSARNAGINIAEGNYLMFVDADDVIHKRTAEIELAAVKEHHADIAICSLRKFKQTEEIDVNSSVNVQGKISVVSGIEAEEGLFNHTIANRYISSCGKIYKRELFDNVRFPEGRLFEDEFTTHKLYYKSDRVVLIDSELYFYYINEAGITQNLNLDKRFDEYDAQKERIKFFKEKGLNSLYHLALLEFLRTAQWDLKAYQERAEKCDWQRGTLFQKQYTEAQEEAKQEDLISFEDHYDYYVLAHPERKTVFRLKRQFLKAIGKMN